VSLAALLAASALILLAALALEPTARTLEVAVPLVFLGAGLALGALSGTARHEVDAGELETAGTIALILILVDGGLRTGIVALRRELAPVLALGIGGTLVTFALVAATTHWLVGLGWTLSLIVGAALSPTDPAAVFSVLHDRSGGSLRVATVLEGEAGFNDPVAVLLVLGFIDWLQRPGYGAADMLGLFARQLGIGLGIGAAIGVLGVLAFRRARLETEGLYPVASIAVAALAYGAADSLHGSGFLAVYLAGLALGSARIPAKRTVLAFHHGLAWIAQLAMFLVLGLLVFPSQLGPVALKGTALALVVVFVARPLAAAVATALAGYSVAERVVLGWAGLRGAVPVVLATFPVIAHVHRSLEFFNIVFFAVLLSTLLQGSTFEPLARRLGATSATTARSP
jgi:potassium/hydrogen antiporter